MNIKGLIKKELKAYFNSPMAYLVVLFFVLTLNIFFFFMPYISFVDNYYASINIQNGRDYLVDGRTLNEEGKKVICDRLMYALTYYDAENAGNVS